jgi:hypothetical protein
MKKLYYAIATLLIMVFIIMGLFNKMRDRGGDDTGYSDNSVTNPVAPDMDTVTLNVDDIEPAPDIDITASPIPVQTDVPIDPSIIDPDEADIPDPVEPVTDQSLPEDVIDLGQLPGNIQAVNYTFRNSRLLNEHYEKHGIEMGFASAAEYEAAASAVINNPAALSKTEKEDGDYVYYLEATNEFVILSTEGYIRTYFLPSAGKAYYDRQ